MSVFAGETAGAAPLSDGLVRFGTADTACPAAALLSNGRYGVMLTAAGAGYSSWRGMDVTRWREDRTRDCWGQFCYVRDLSSGAVWSAGHQPLCRPATAFEAVFRPERVDLGRRDGDIETRLSVCVSPDHDAEVRLVTIVNHGDRPCDIELTSYAEVCLDHRRADQAHPAFAKLFLETEYLSASGGLLCRRRPRAADQKPVWAIHVSAAEGQVEYETDRARFLGRGRTVADPLALDRERLSGTTGPVLDPVFSLRRTVHLAVGATTRVAFVTGAAETREQAVALVERFGHLSAADEAFERARAQNIASLRELGLSAKEVPALNRLAAAVLFADPELRSEEAAAANRLGQPGLWPYAISGDRPIVVGRIGTDGENFVQELIRWHAYVRHRGLDLDLVLLEERSADDERLKAIVKRSPEVKLLGSPGGVFVLAAASVAEEGQILIGAAARAILDDRLGSLDEQLRSEIDLKAPPGRRRTNPQRRRERGRPSPPPASDLLCWNGFGGFSRDGREYVISIDDGPDDSRRPPAPWTNVLANSGFGCLVTDGGLGYTWAGNSQMNRLTPWSNDPVADPPGEAVYLRDEATGEVWSPTPLPCGSGATVTVHHGQGYTRYVRLGEGLEQELLVTVPPEEPAKVVRLTVRNTGDRERRLKACYYAEWVLGTVRENAPLQVVCERDAEAGAVLARSAWAGAFAGQIAFLAAGERPHSFTADRTEFLGRNGSLDAPAALELPELSGRVGTNLDPCAAVMTALTIAPGESEEVVFLLGQAGDLDEVRRLARSYASSDGAARALDASRSLWDGVLDSIQVRTPDPTIDLLANRWLLYQALGCRVWARSAFYQSGGAYGFRDQLQDVMALVWAAPEETRAQILRAAARQFEEGDVQHWWHPPTGAGVRTRITDDLFFLPFVTHHYIIVTGDAAVLDEPVPFLKSPVLRPDQEEDFNVPAVGAESAPLYDHCVRVLEHGYRLGPHGLPLMGTGDWNDGMNKVGAHGRGESVWNGWFILTVLRSFAELAESRGDVARAAWCRERAEALRGALEQHAWDGQWYRRAYFDDGTPLGSATNDECQIDALPQAWAVISGAGEPARASQAMAAVDERLVDPAARMIRLFTPPFDRSALEPGYIKGYVPGIRENGGQYTHGVTWVVLAAALQGRGDRAVELWNFLNPIHHTRTPGDVEVYKVEPYVVCADVYGAAPHTGRGGWTWYTGAAGWMYRILIEAILGLRVRGDTLRLEPCFPEAWPSCEMRYRYRSATYVIHFDNSSGTGRGVRSVTVDGSPVEGNAVPLRDDGMKHEVHAVLGQAGS